MAAMGGGGACGCLLCRWEVVARATMSAKGACPLLVGRELRVREHLSAGRFSVLSEFVSMGDGTSVGVAVAVVGVVVTLLPPPRPPRLWKRWTTYTPTSRVSLQSRRRRHRKNETAVP